MEHKDIKQEKTILVSIRCSVYNHEPYLRQCLDGFVMQQTNFAFEAIVHDDASTDKSADIIREYAAIYPNIIKPIYETENQYSKHDGSKRRIMNAAINESAKYIAFCEGDDYWTDPLKLQKQFDFMEANPDYSLCFHNAMIHYQDGRDKDRIFAELEERDYIPAELYEKWLVPTASIFTRKDIYLQQQPKLNNPNFLYGDNPLIISLAYAGKVHCINEIMSVYRRHIGGVTSIPKDAEKELQHHINMYKIFGNALKPNARKIIFGCAYSLMLQSIKEHKYISSIRYMYLSILNNPKRFITNILSRVWPIATNKCINKDINH